MISAPGITKRSIKSHYDLATPFYRLLWGPHIHHGLWDDERATGRSPRAAQLHLTDTRAFFARAASWLQPSGRMAICAWLAAEDADLPAKRPQVEKVYESFLCPSLGSFSDYSCWMEAAGLVVDVADDWTGRVARTWELCEDRVRAWGIDRVAPWKDPARSLFIEHFSTLLDAYRSGAMQYGCFVAHRPPDTPS